jgi:hypothetical protein
VWRAGRSGYGVIRQGEGAVLARLPQAGGVPSHDTFSRLFRQLDLEQFRAAFQRFMASFAKGF